MQVVEVGPRDGLQNEKRKLTVDEKVEYIEKLLAAGVTRMEAVSFAHPGRVPQMAGAEEVMARVPRNVGASYIGLVMNERGAQRAIESKVDEANIVVVATDTFAQRNQGMTTAQSIDAAKRMVHMLRSADIAVSITVGAAFGCPFEGEVSAARVTEILDEIAELDIQEMALADTIGVAVPANLREIVPLALERTDSPLRLHLHNTRNNGYANALAALDLGVGVLDASSGGIGGCPFAPAATGNIATEDLIYLAERSGHATGLDFEKMLEASSFVTDLLEVEPPALLGKAGLFPPN